MVFTINNLGLRDKEFLSYVGAPAGSQVNVSTVTSGTSATINTIANEVATTSVNIQSGTAHATSGASLNTSELTRKSVFITALTDGSGTGTGSQLFVEIHVSPDGNFLGEENIIDSKRYESGTATQLDVFSYNSHFPFMRTQMIGSNVANMDVSTTITGRGI